MDEPLWLLSFADPDRFLGGAVTQAPTMDDAFATTQRLGIYPGGQIQITGPMEPWTVAVEWRDRLLTEDELVNLPNPFAEACEHTPGCRMLKTEGLTCNCHDHTPRRAE